MLDNNTSLLYGYIEETIYLIYSFRGDLLK